MPCNIEYHTIFNNTIDSIASNENRRKIIEGRELKEEDRRKRVEGRELKEADTKNEDGKRKKEGENI